MKKIVPSLVFLIGWAALEGADSSVAERRIKAEAGDVAAQVQLASDYDFGRGVPQDYGLAAHWYQKAADTGDRVAQNNLGSLYQNGMGVTKDYGKAVALYRASAAQGFPLAENSLGMMYDLGLGVIGVFT